MSPLLAIYAAVTRRTLDGRNPGGWIPAEKLGIEEAVRASTVNGAYAEFAEADKGTLEAGKLADLAVLDRDIFTVPPEEIGGARVRMTVFDGRIVHREEGRT
jgi:predicted amidohydrolase YtcJ